MVKWPKKMRINYCQAGFRDHLDYLEKQPSQAKQGGGVQASQARQKSEAIHEAELSRLMASLGRRGGWGAGCSQAGSEPDSDSHTHSGTADHFYSQEVWHTASSWCNWRKPLAQAGAY